MDTQQADWLLCPEASETIIWYGRPIRRPRNLQREDWRVGPYCSYIYVGKELTAAGSPTVPVVFEPLSNHNGDGSNVLFADGHVAWVPKDELHEVLTPDMLARAAATRPATAPAE